MSFLVEQLVVLSNDLSKVIYLDTLFNLLGATLHVLVLKHLLQVVFQIEI